MAKFTVRIVLHGANWSDYERLQKEAASRGLVDIIVDSNGVRYKMPDAEYNFEGEATRQQVLDLAKASARATGKTFAVLVTESSGRTWEGLEQVRRAA